MKYGLFSGIFWALDTVLLGIALSLVLPGDNFLNCQATLVLTPLTTPELTPSS